MQKVKEVVEGLIERYKAPRRGKGFLQQYVVDFERTFVRVAKFASILIILRHRGAVQARAAPGGSQGGAPQRLLKEEIHLMKQPDKVVDPKHLDHVSKLKCALYGRKQSPRMLNEVIDDHMRNMSGSSSAR